MILTIIGLVILLLQKRKRGLFISVVSVIVNIVYSLICGESPFVLIIILLPIVYAVISILKELSELEM